MQYIILSLICSLLVGILFKYAKQSNVNNMQMINWSYLYAIILSLTLFNSTPISFTTPNVPWHLIIPLWILMPTLFLIFALSIKQVGIAKTDVAQRLSLFISLACAFFLFNESFSWLKILGCGLALLAIMLTLHKPSLKTIDNKQYIYPLIVLLGWATVDVLFKSITLARHFPYTSILTLVFYGALVVALVINLWLILSKQNKFDLKAVIWGPLLGVLNFGNIYFYLKAHVALKDNPAIVFTVMNVGVMLLGCLAGVFLFKEKLVKLNYIGIILAILSVLIISYTKYS